MSGFSLVELVTATAVGSIVISLSLSLMQNMYQEKMRADFLLSLTELRIYFQQTVLKPQSWNQTMLNNPLMSCFRGTTPSSCLALNGASAAELRLHLSSGELLYDSSNATSGYTLSGTPCSTYGTSSNCVLKPLLRWQAQCNLAVDPNCNSPLVIITLNYTFSGSGMESINFNSYGFRISKSTFPLQVVNPCGGAVPVCSPSQAILCESGSWVCREFGS